MTFQQISSNAEVQSRYETMRRKGESHAMAEMLATRRAPNLNGTDTAFLRGKHLNNGLENNWIGDEMRTKARSAGIPIDGKVYVAQLADTRGAADPKAWVSDTGDIKRVCEQNGWGCDGSVKTARYEGKPLEQVRLAEDIVVEKMESAIEKNPDLKRNLPELRESIIEKHGAKVDDVKYAKKATSQKTRKA